MSFLWQKIARPLLFRIDAEKAHELGIEALRRGLAAPFYVDDPTFGFAPTRVFGLRFTNPLGVAAGFDKNAVVVNELAALGFGFVEVGTVTLDPQAGNRRPRLFRLPDDKALINRLGFNNDGARVIAERLSRIERRCVVGVNIGRNREVSNEDAVKNYLECFRIVHAVADYVAVNVSSPNTPGLRDLQQAGQLRQLLAALQETNDKLGPKPLLVKIAPDLAEDDLTAIVEAVIDLGIDGIIATNTTTSRIGLQTDASSFGDGGLSGAPLKPLSDQVVVRIDQETAGKVPIIGTGGIFALHDAADKLAAGATLLQAYTGFVYGGPAFPKAVLDGLAPFVDTRS